MTDQAEIRGGGPWRTRTFRYVLAKGTAYIRIVESEEGRPLMVFGSLGKAGTEISGMTELVCRLVALLLQHGTPLEDIIKQCEGIGEMQPWPNKIDEEVKHLGGIGDSIATALAEYL